jgi:hypothetical protein
MDKGEKLGILTVEEAEEKIKELISQIPEEGYFMGIFRGFPVIKLCNPSIIKLNNDGTIDWEAHEVSVGMHTFIEISTGPKKDNKFVICLCLINSEIRPFIEALIHTTIDPKDGRFNSKDAELILIIDDEKIFKIHFPLPGLSTNYLMLYLVPDICSHYKSKYCPLCKEVQESD